MVPGIRIHPRAASPLLARGRVSLGSSAKKLGVVSNLRQRHFQIISSSIFQQQSIRFLSVEADLSSLNKIVLKPWKEQMYESNGDYRNEAHLEDHIGGPLYEAQKTLPRLPVPSIEDTLERFLPTALPLAKNDQERAALIKSVQDFPHQAKVLQERLLERKEEMSDSSWLQLWWNTLGYLQVRDPVVVNVSYFFHFVDDPTISVTAEANLQRGAALLYAAAEFRKLVCSGELPQERVGKNRVPLCSTAYKYQFNSCRIPQSGQDSYRIYDPSRHTHCIVARKGHFFSIELVYPDGSGDPMPLLAIEDQLRRCIEMADDIPETRPKLGILTSDNRDNWADARKRLVGLGGISMQEALKTLESGALLLSLDDESPVSRQECCETFLHGGTRSGCNRWVSTITLQWGYLFHYVHMVFVKLWHF
jgi:carnitine O-acetyltransferase